MPSMSVNGSNRKAKFDLVHLQLEQLRQAHPSSIVQRSEPRHPQRHSDKLRRTICFIYTSNTLSFTDFHCHVKYTISLWWFQLFSSGSLALEPKRKTSEINYSIAFVTTNIDSIARPRYFPALEENRKPGK